jgi:hypothetical protein
MPRRGYAGGLPSLALGPEAEALARAATSDLVVDACTARGRDAPRHRRALAHGDDHVALLVPGVHVSVRFDDLFQRIGSVNDGP